MRIATVGRTAAVSWLVIALAGSAMAQQKSDEAVKAEVLKVSAQFDAAREAKDRATMESILADGLTWIARGDRLNKSQVIADVLASNLHFKYFAHDSVAATVFGDTVVITGHSTSILEYKGKQYDAPRLFTDVYVKMNGRWQMAAHQVSDLAKP